MEFSDQAERDTLDLQTRRAFSVAAGVRFSAVGFFVALSLALWATGARGWSDAVGPLLSAGVFTGGIFALRDKRWIIKVAPFTFLIDVLVVFAVQWRTMPTSPFPAGVAGFSLGLFALLVGLAGSTMRRRSTFATAGLATVAQIALMREAGVGLGAQISAFVVLGLISITQASFVQRIRRMVRTLASTEVARQIEVARVETLQTSRETIERLFQDARLQNTKLTELQRDKDVLMSLLVHDLRAPLGAVRANLDFVKAELPKDFDADVVSAVSESRQVTDRLASMIGDLLNISKLEDQSLPLQLELSSPVELVSAVHKQVKAQARSRNIDVHINTEPCEVRVDKALLMRTLENLSSNALRYTPTGGRILLEVRLDAGGVMLAVRNDGTPIPHEARARLFDKFVQGGTTAENRRSGWGLGLYFCKLAIDAHKGFIAVEEHEEWPTSFVLRLPLAKPETQREAA